MIARKDGIPFALEPVPKMERRYHVDSWQLMSAAIVRFTVSGSGSLVDVTMNPGNLAVAEPHKWSLLMPLLVLASDTDIARWAATRGAQDRFPELLRRLVYATTEAPTLVDFPSGDAVQLGGWDGVVELSEDHATIPKGLSGWETGTSANPKAKADGDYDTRTASPPPTARGPVVPSETTFVFVTPRLWGAKKKWAERRRTGKVWKDVRVLDAVDIEAWVQQAPATHVWLSRLMGLVPAGADDIETVWTDWAEGITPQATPALVLAGRAGETAGIVKWLNSAGRGSLTVSAESMDDAVGVIAAAIMSLPAAEQTPILARTVVVSTPDAFTQLAGSSEPLILIPTYVAGAEIQRATRGGHQVVIPTGPVPASAAGSAHVVMPRVHRRDAESALVAMGLREDRARELAGIARRSMLTLRRRLATNPSLQLPQWAAPNVGPSLVPMLLLGQFDESRDADLQVLSALAPGGLATMRETLLRWSQEVDPPVRRVGNIWYLVSKVDAWALLSRYVSSDDLKHFATVAKDVLGEVHPKFDLPPEERWAASIHGKERQYSSTLVTGGADTIALLGASGDSVTVQGGAPLSMVADRIVRDLFDAVAGDWRGWATLSRVLPLLAEGAPDAFLKAVETQIASDEEAVKTLFRDDGDVMFSSSSHTGVLWALEMTAWSPEHLAYSARMLATLDRLDPGGKTLNRPGNSLRSIFLSWLPQTSAGLETRLDVLDQLRAHEPDASWRLLASLLPRNHDHSGYNPRPKWRDWVVEGAGTGATYYDINRQTSTIVGWMVGDAGETPTRWITLIEALDDVGPDEFTAITTTLADFLGRLSDDEIRAPIFDALRQTLSRHRSFPEATWALSDERLEKIEPLFIAATPRDAFARLRWLFSNHPQLPEGREADYHEQSALVFERQQEAIRELHAELGTGGVVELAGRVERPDDLGRVLASAGVLSSYEEDQLLDRLLGATDRPTFAFGRGYANGWTVRVGEELALKRIGNRDEPWTDETRGRLLLSHAPTAATLDLVDTLGDGGQAAFWSGMYPVWLDDAVVECGLRALLAFGRSHAVIDAAAMHLRKHPTLDPELLASALEQAPLQRTDKDGTQMTAYAIGLVLDALERAVQDDRFDEARVAQLEFLYLPILGHFERPPRILHKAMANDPSLFVEAVRMAYRARGEEPHDLSPEDASRAQHAYRLLDTWRVPPGQTGPGIDSVVLNDWVDRARTELALLGRGEIGDHLMGSVMSGPAVDADGVWPRIAIRDLIERLASDDFEQGLVIGRYNGRGVISRDPFAGGKLERGEAEAYERMATTTATCWPRTSAVQRRMARHARADAAREDIESELLEDLES